MKTDLFCEEQNRVEFHRGTVNVTPSFDLALHTAMPENNDQSSNEISLSGYERFPIMRNTESWTVRGRKITNAALIRFSTITSGKATATWLSIGIGGKIRRLVKLTEPLELKANNRVEIEPGDIEILDKE